MALYKKRIRLKEFDYTGCYRYFITLGTHDKDSTFKNNPQVVEWLIDVLKEKSESHGFRVWAYCFMPDHLHLLIEGKDIHSDMRRFTSSYKQSTGFLFKKKMGVSLWQINYYEHVLRREEEDTMEVVRYILGNPVRKGLVSDFWEYKFLGSFELDVKEI